MKLAASWRRLCGSTITPAPRKSSMVTEKMDLTMETSPTVQPGQVRLAEVLVRKGISQAR